MIIFTDRELLAYSQDFYCFITITIITDNRLQVRSFPDTAVCPSVHVQQNATNTAGCSSDCRKVATVVPKKRPEIKCFQRPVVWATEPSFTEVNLMFIGPCIIAIVDE
jgi:hypothetical protein